MTDPKGMSKRTREPGQRGCCRRRTRPAMPDRHTTSGGLVAPELLDTRGPHAETSVWNLSYTATSMSITFNSLATQASGVQLPGGPCRESPGAESPCPISG